MSDKCCSCGSPAPSDSGTTAVPAQKKAAQRRPGAVLSQVFSGLSSAASPTLPPAVHAWQEKARLSVPVDCSWVHLKFVEFQPCDSDASIETASSSVISPSSARIAAKLASPALACCCTT